MNPIQPFDRAQHPPLPPEGGQALPVQPSVQESRQQALQQIENDLLENDALLRQHSLLDREHTSQFIQPLLTLFKEWRGNEALCMSPQRALVLNSLGFSACHTEYEEWHLPQVALLNRTIFEMIQNNEREIFSVDVPVQELSSAMKQLEIVTRLENNDPATVTEMANEVQQRVLQLQTGESYCMRGGWIGRDCHDMAYRFQKNANGTFDLSIY